MTQPILSDDFPEEIKALLRDELACGAKIGAGVVDTILRTMKIEIGQLMVMLLPTAAAYARTPISQYNVGTVAQGKTPSSLYLGSNMEFAGEALSFSVHGEQSALTNAWLHGEQGILAIAINAAPCGYCRQFLYEVSTATTDLQILLKTSEDPSDYSYTKHPLTYYLPDAFGPQDLDIEARLMRAEDHGLTVESDDPVALAALAAANASYAPYSQNYCGVALQQSDGVIYAGRYAENAAYNPSMSPLESALAFMNMNSPVQAPYDIVTAVLVEAGSSVSQRSATQAILAKVAPDVTLQYFLVR